MSWIDAYFDALAQEVAEPVHLRVIGSVALFLQSPYSRGTKDGDVIRTAMSQRHVDALIECAGPGTSLHERHGIYIDIVSPNIR